MTYHEEGQRVVVSEGATTLILGTPPTDIKIGNDGFNHDDLGWGAMMNFLSFPPQRSIELSFGESYLIPSFVAYRVRGEYRFEDNGVKNEVRIPLS